jgi:hypothetical protein
MAIATAIFDRHFLSVTSAHTRGFTYEMFKDVFLKDYSLPGATVFLLDR